MEVSEVRKRVYDAIERARQAAAARRTQNEIAEKVWSAVREQSVVPLCRQLVQVLKAEGYTFQVSTPSDTVRLTSERSAQDFMELLLDTAGRVPAVVCRVNRVRGREILNEDRVVAPTTPIEAITEEDVLTTLVEALPPFVER
jgi:hypothetical protein